MRIALISDTHGVLDADVVHYVSECDEVWHAGDFGNAEVMEQLRAVTPTRGVYGNVDGPDVRAEMPEDLVWDCGGVRVYMTHIGGYPGRYERRVKKELVRNEPALFICGHSHTLRVMQDLDLGLLCMNPGACGHQGWHTMRTMLRFRIEGAAVSDVEAIPLGPRGRQR